MDIASLTVGQWQDCVILRGATVLMPNLLFHSFVGRRFVRKNADESLSWAVEIEARMSLMKSSRLPGNVALALSSLLQQLQEAGIEVMEIGYSEARKFSYSWHPEYQAQGREMARMIDSGLAEFVFKPKDLIYIIGPDGVEQQSLMDIWQVKKVDELGLIVSSIRTPRYFSQQRVEQAQLAWLMPVVVVRGLNLKGTVVLGKKIVLTEDQTIIRANHLSMAQYPPIVEGLILT